MSFAHVKSRRWLICQNHLEKTKLKKVSQNNQEFQKMSIYCHQNDSHFIRTGLQKLQFTSTKTIFHFNMTLKFRLSEDLS